jgi:hypothetical protein
MNPSNQTSPGERKDATNPDRPQGSARKRPVQPVVPEIGGPKGPEPTRYGDWEKGGRCTDF